MSERVRNFHGGGEMRRYYLHTSNLSVHVAASTDSQGQRTIFCNSLWYIELRKYTKKYAIA
jgi:hypothetical protein